MIGENKALQPSKYFIVTFALFSNGEVSTRLIQQQCVANTKSEVVVAIQYCMFLRYQYPGFLA